MATIATSPRHPETFHHWWAWILAAVGLAFAVGAAVLVADAIRSGGDEPTTAAVSGEAGVLDEATPIHIAAPGVTTAYVGLNPAFDPDVGPSGLIDEATPMHIAAPGVTTVYLGNSGEMYAEE